MGQYELSERDSANLSFGQAGVVNTIGITLVSGDFIALQILESGTTFSTLNEDYASGDSLIGKALNQNILYGSFTGYQLSSGSVRAYKRGG